MGDAVAAPYLKVSPNGRYLIDGNNSDLPFLVHGDSPLELTANLTLLEVYSYLDDRKSRGFNAVVAELTRYEPARFTPANKNAAGVRPFDSSDDFSRPTEAYWANVDSVIAAAGSREMVVFAFVAYAGEAASGSGYVDNAVITGQQASMRGYGRFLGRRYRTTDNIVWCMWGGRDPGTKDLYRQIAEGIAETDNLKPKLMTSQAARGSSSGPTFLGETWHRVTSVYAVSDHTLYETARSEYASSHVAPVILSGAYFEGEHSITARDVRRNSYWALTSGAAGSFFGNGTVWPFASGWQAALASNGAVHMRHAWEAASERDWYKLIPDVSHVVCTGGYGTDGTDNHATAARTSDGSLVMVYVPTATSPVVDMTKLRGKAHATWRDPTTGDVTSIAGSPFASTGSQTFTHPGNNAAGDPDWLLVIETDPPPGLIAVHSSSRYLVNARGRPFPWLEHVWQTVLTQQPTANFDTLLNKLKARGFTSLRFMLEVRAGGGTFATHDEPRDAQGNEPFTTPDFLDTLNPVYMANVLVLCRKALERGLLVSPFILYPGYQGGNQGWEAILTTGAAGTHNTNAICRQYGRDIANYFLPYPNVILMLLGDDTLSGTALTKYMEIIGGMQEVTTKWIAGSEPAPPNNRCTVQGSFTFGAGGTQQIGSIYAAGPGANGECAPDVDAAYDASPTLPLHGTDEPFYGNTWGSLNTREKCRKFQYWSGGAGGWRVGNCHGNDNCFNAATAAGGLATLDDVATTDAKYLNTFLRSIPFWKMLPSGTAADRAGRTLIASGGGSGSTQIVAMQSSDGRFLVAYTPATGGGAVTFAMNLTGMAGACRARWFNVADGTYQSEATCAGLYTLSKSATAQSFTTPGSNGNDNDWVLVVDALA